jgi:predicted nucleic acid-binding protein
VSVVLDSSALVAALVDSGGDGEWAEALIGGRALHAPDLVLAESSNVLRRLELAGEISSAEANAAQADLMRLDIDLHAFAPFAERIWELRGNLTSYDAWYVAIAEASGFPIATLDRKLSRVRGLRCRFLTPER